MKQNHKILLGIGAGAGLAYVLHLMSKRNGGAGIASAPTGTAFEPLSRGEKEAFIIESLMPDEDMTGFDGDRFHYDPTLGYELPVGTIEVADAGDEMILPREGNLAQEVFFNAEGMKNDRGDRTLVHKMRPMETQEQVFAKTKELPLDPTAEAESIMDEMTDDEVDMAYEVAKNIKIDPTMTKAEILEALGIDASATGVFNKEIKPRLRVIKKLKKKPNWNSRWTARKGKMRGKIASRIAKGKGRGIGRGIGREVSAEKRAKRCDGVCRAKHPFNKDKKRACVDKCVTRESFKDQVTQRTDGAMWGGHRQDGRPTLPPAIEKLKPKKPVFNNKQKRDHCGRVCGAKHAFNKGKRNKCKEGCWVKFP